MPLLKILKSQRRTCEDSAFFLANMRVPLVRDKNYTSDFVIIWLKKNKKAQLAMLNMIITTWMNNHKNWKREKERGWKPSQNTLNPKLRPLNRKQKMCY